MTSDDRPISDQTPMTESSVQEPRHGSNYKDKVPYCKRICEGCWSDQDNRILMPDECQAYISRPLDESVGPCPFHSTEKYGRKLPPLDFEDDGSPKVSSRFAEIVSRGVNEGIFAYWECNSFAWRYMLPGIHSAGEFQNWDIIYYDDSGFRIKVGRQKKLSRGDYPIFRGTIDRADIVDNALILTARDSGTDIRVCIEIVDPGIRTEAPAIKELSRTQRDLFSFHMEGSQ